MKKIIQKIKIIKNLAAIKYSINTFLIVFLMLIILTENDDSGSGFKTFMFFMIIFCIITNLLLVILLILKSKSIYISLSSNKNDVIEEINSFKKSVLVWSILSIFFIFIADLVILNLSTRNSSFLRKKIKKQSFKKIFKDDLFNKKIINQKHSTSNIKSEFEYVED